MTEQKRLKLDGQPMRLLRWLRDHPGASSLEITQALSIVNVTGRVSDLRKAGYLIDCRKAPVSRLDCYYVRDSKPVLTGEQIGAFG
jgi:hypothetical protein